MAPARTANRTASATFPGSAPTIANSTSPIDRMSSLTRYNVSTFRVTPAIPSRALTPYDPNMATRMSTSPGGGLTVPRRLAARSF